MTQNKDYMIRGIDKEGNFRFFGANSRNLVNEACMKHQTTPVASAALGRALTANVMMGSMLKRDQDRVSIIIKGDGDSSLIQLVLPIKTYEFYRQKCLL